uniref:Uncharacterized protein n=1 Tax=Glossina austeni TaxID=7395 RepID=A0A1A9VXR3_GLOAU
MRASVLLKNLCVFVILNLLCFSVEEVEPAVDCYSCTFPRDWECNALAALTTKDGFLRTCNDSCSVLIGQDGRMGAYEESVTLTRDCYPIPACSSNSSICSERERFKRKAQFVNDLHSAHSLLPWKEEIKSLFESFRTSYNDLLAVFDETEAEAPLAEIRTQYLTIYKSSYPVSSYLQCSSFISAEFDKFQHSSVPHEDIKIPVIPNVLLPPKDIIKISLLTNEGFALARQDLVESYGNKRIIIIPNSEPFPI